MLGRLHIITDTRFGRDPLLISRLAVGAGAEVVQVRAKDYTDRGLYLLAEAVVDLCRQHGAACIVDDRVDVALAVGAQGVHVGAEDLPVAAVRAVAGSGLIVGATVRSAEEAQRAEADGADYLGVGPCYSTSTKAGLPSPLGLEGLAAVARSVDLPVVAIGGIRADRVAEVMATGAHGVAVVDAVSGSPHPASAVAELRAALGGQA